MAWQQAQDTFVAELKDGTIQRVMKGEVLPDRHELVKRDLQGSGTLFRPLLGEDDKAPAKSGPEAAVPGEAAPQDDLLPEDGAVVPAARAARVRPARPAGGKG